MLDVYYADVTVDVASRDAAHCASESAASSRPTPAAAAVINPWCDVIIRNNRTMPTLDVNILQSS